MVYIVKDWRNDRVLVDLFFLFYDRSMKSQMGKEQWEHKQERSICFTEDGLRYEELEEWSCVF